MVSMHSQGLISTDRDINAYGAVHGGVILSWLAQTADQVAQGMNQHAKLAKVIRVDFMHPVGVGQPLRLCSEIVAQHPNQVIVTAWLEVESPVQRNDPSTPLAYGQFCYSI